MGKLIDLTGQKFGRLTVLKRGEDYLYKNGTKEVRWWCQCDCGSEPKLIFGSGLRYGKIISCGCYQTEVRIQNNKKYKKKYNNYNLSGEYGIGYLENGNEFYFDLEDYEMIKDFYWKDVHGYISTCDNIKLHRLVMGLTNDDVKVVDHIKGSDTKYDNRKSNLRIVTQSENSMNRCLRTDNTSGVSGVSWNNSCGLWQVEITVKSKRIYLGTFINKEDAIRVRKEAEDKYFGEYSFDNSRK